MSNLEAALDVDLSIQLERCWETGIGRGGAFTSSKDPLAGYIGWSDHKAVQQKQRLSPCSMEICDANLRLDTAKLLLVVFGTSRTLAGVLHLI